MRSHTTAAATRSGDDFIREGGRDEQFALRADRGAVRAEAGGAVPAAAAPAPRGALYVAFELGWSQWKLAFSTDQRRKPRRRTVPARDLAALSREIEKAKTRFGLPIEAPVYSCYEAGRDGFWLHRYLVSQGIENVIVDSSSIEVNRRARRAKNDALDAGKLLTMLLRYHGGERDLWSVLGVPTAEAEDVRQRQREIETLRDDRKRHVNRIKGLLAAQGVALQVDTRLKDRLGSIRLWNGQPLPAHLQARLERELERLALVDDQLKRIEQARREHERQANDAWAKQVRQLCALRGIGPESAWLTVGELFGWREIRNRKQLAALAGLGPTPYASGTVQHEQGISKAGNKRVRTMMVQIAWGWLRFQPQSELSQWYQRRFGSGGQRRRRTGIVALARKLLVALWRYLQTGQPPSGARLQVT